MARFGDWEFTYDRKATVEAYRNAGSGGVRTCNCAGCRNFVAVGPDVFPTRFLRFLDDLGIDPAKDGEVYHVARLAPSQHAYGGWYHFVGTLEVAGDFAPVEFSDGFSSQLSLGSAPRIDTLVEQSVVQVDFNADRIPWVLSEQELD